MSKNNYRLAVIVSLLIVLFLMINHSKGPASEPNDSYVIQKMSSKIDSMMNVIKSRDTLIVSRDTVVYRTNKIKEIIKEYSTTTDTIIKIKLCDTLAVKCDSIASQYSRNDSLFREQVKSYKSIVSAKDSIINNQQKDIAKLGRRVKFAAAVSAIAAAAITTIILK